MKRTDRTSRRTVQKVLRLVGRYWGYLALSLLLSVLVVALTLYVPILIGDAIDAIVAPGSVRMEEILPILVRIAVLVVGTAASQWLMGLCNNRIAYLVVRDVRREAIRKIQKLPLSYIDAHTYGDVVSRVIADTDQFADGLLLGFTQFFTGVLTIVGTLAFMLWLNWKIALAVVLITPLSLFAAKFISGRTYALFGKQSAARGEQTAFVDEMIAGQKVVRAFSRERETLQTFDEKNEELGKWSLKALFYSSITNPCTRFVNNLVYAAVALLGALSVIAGTGFTVGHLNSFLSYANQYTKPFNEISGVAAELQGALACADRMFEFLEERELPPEPEVRLPAVRGEVSLENVSFSYTPDKPLISDFCLHVPPGRRVAIVGPTGCGKTTLINLLMRFYDPDAGTIRVDGTDVRTVSRQSLRAQYGMVLQETWLLRGTVRENIAMGSKATDAEIVAAAKSAHAHEFIVKLQNGYDTVLTENSLSQGQRQLLCIARIFLCLPPMLILDEATSSIDTRTELEIQRAFDAMSAGRTSFIVAHRLSTIREADVILVMRDGNVVEQGRHAELLARGGFYAQLYLSQFEP